MSVIYSTRLGLRPEFGRLLADQCAAYLALRFPGLAFDVTLGGTSPLGHRSYCVLLCSDQDEEAAALTQAAAEAFAYGFRTGWAQRARNPELNEIGDGPADH